MAAWRTLFHQCQARHSGLNRPRRGVSKPRRRSHTPTLRRQPPCPGGPVPTAGLEPMSLSSLQLAPNARSIEHRSTNARWVGLWGRDTSPERPETEEAVVELVREGRSSDGSRADTTYHRMPATTPALVACRSSMTLQQSCAQGPPCADDGYRLRGFLWRGWGLGPTSASLGRCSDSNMRGVPCGGQATCFIIGQLWVTMSPDGQEA